MVAFIEEILNGKLHLFCAVAATIIQAIFIKTYLAEELLVNKKFYLRKFYANYLNVHLTATLQNAILNFYGSS